MNTRTRPRHRTRYWDYEGVPYCVDQDFTDSILLRANRLIPKISADLRSVCVGHAPSELDLNGGRTTGAGTEYGHLRFWIPQSWEWLTEIANLSWLPDTAVVHTVNYRFAQGPPTAYLEITCLIRANTRNVRKRLHWWDVLLNELEQLTAR